MNWQHPSHPQFPAGFNDGVLHPGMYVSDLEQHAFYHQQAQMEQGGGIHPSLVFGNTNYYGSGVPGNDEALYAAVPMPVYLSQINYPAGASLSPEAIAAGPERGATAPNHNRSPSVPSCNLPQRGHGDQGKRGGKQNHFNQQFGRRRREYNAPSSAPFDYPEDEFYDEYGYPYQNCDINPYSNYRRDSRGGRSAETTANRGRGFNDRSKHAKDSRPVSSHGNTYRKKDDSQALRGVEHRHTSNGSNYVSHRGHARDPPFNHQLLNNERGKQGKYSNYTRPGSVSYHQGATGTSNGRYVDRNGGKAAQEPPTGDRHDEVLEREDLQEENQIAGTPRKSSGHFSSTDKAQSFHNKNRAVDNSSRQKRTKNIFKSEPKETDESQRTSLTEQLSTNTYECMVCCDYIQVEDAVWSCGKCFHVFHLACIKKWAKSSFCEDSRSWRCPGCQNESTYIPSQYRCFCGRRRDPKYIRGENPHGCGEICRRKRTGDCRHPCTILCHPGPCPPCSSMISIKCDCGKIRKSVRCSASTQFKCDSVCDKALNCGEHRCVLQCHSGPCPPCNVSKTQECFCKKRDRTVICGTDEYAMISFSCEKPCGRTLGCGNHVCEELCHPGECAPCGLAPGNLRFCCCGKKEIQELDCPERKSCLDPVPTCGQICHKPMACGSALLPHLCERECHDGECGPCNKETTLRCECGATEKKMLCEIAVTFTASNPFKCQKRCGKKKTCGRHKCSDTCCVRDIHICEIVCGKKLSCGIHRCEELCHRGNCKRCLQASFDELTCYCGAEVLEPPVPCGTRRPECHLPCTRRHECNHEVRHQCHAEEKCPPCTELTDKLCMGGHTVRKNVPCYLDIVSCGYPCHKKLPCGQHLCQKKCHGGDCLDAGVSCKQACQRVREACGHPCGAPCHTGDCPDTACKMEITITCPCGNRSTKAQCLVGGDLQSNIAQFQRLSVQSMMESDGQSIDMAQFAQVKKSSKRLDCDTNCAIIERNKRLALALEIKNPDMDAKLGNPSFSDFLVEFAKKNPKFASTVEKSLNDLVQSVKQTGQSSKTHTFPSMNRDQRHFVHELGEAYGCQTQSYDYEPNKNVVATAVRDKCWLPNVTLVNHALKEQKPQKKMGVSFTTMKKEVIEKVPDKPSSSRAWETTSLRPSSSTATRAASASTAGATAASPKQPAPVIDYFDFDG